MAALTANFEADFSKFNDAVQQAVVELDGFEKGAAKAEGALDRMASRFSGEKVIQDATLMAEAIERLGGVSTLTEAELARVGKTAGEAVEKMTALGMDVPKNLQELADATKGAGQETESLSVSVGNLAASYVTAEVAIRLVEGAYHALVDATKAVIASAADAEEIDSALLAALEAQGTAVPSVVEAYDKYAQALQATTRYSDDAVKSAERILAQIGGVMPRDMERATKAAADLATVLHIDLSSAAMMVAKAAEGQTTALKKAGIVFDETKGNADDFGDVLTQLEAKIHGAADAAGTTFPGELDKLRNAWDNVLEATGRVITDNATVREALAGLTDILTGNTSELNANATANNLVSEAVILVAKGLTLGVDAIDYFQKELKDARVVLDLFATGLTVMYLGLQKVEEATQKPLAWAGSDDAVKRVQEAGQAIEWAHGQLTELHADMDNAKATSAEWSASLQGLRGSLEDLTGRLEATRGQTRELAAAGDDASGVWDRNTEAINANENALKAGRDEMARVQVEVDAVAKAALKALAEGFQEEQRLDKEAAAYKLTLAKLDAEYYHAKTALSRDTLQAQEADIDEWVKVQLAALEKVGQATEEASAKVQAIADQQKTNLAEELAAQDKTTEFYYQEQAKKAEANYAYLTAHQELFSQQSLAIAYEKMTKANEALADWGTRAQQEFEKVTDVAGGTAQAFGRVTDAISGSIAAGTSFADQITAMQTLTADFVDTLTSGGVLGSWLNFKSEGFGSAAAMNRSYGGGMAAGGPVSAGSAYMVGEQGPELFIPNSAGTILPTFVPGGNGGAGGATVNIASGAFVLNYPIVNNPQALDQLARTVGDAILTKLTRAGARL